MNQKKSEELVKSAEAALKAAMEELNKQEEAYQAQIKTLENVCIDSPSSLHVLTCVRNPLTRK